MKLTIGDLKEMLREWPDTIEIQFSGGLEFHRLKWRGDGLVQVEFNENVWRDSNGSWHVDGAE